MLKSIKRVEGNDASLHTKNSDELYLGLISDVNRSSFEANETTGKATLAMQTGKHLVRLGCKAASVVPTVEAGETPLTEKATVAAVLDGAEAKTVQAVRRMRGSRVIVVWKRCIDGRMFLAGTPCSDGMRMRVTSIGAQDGGENGIALSFEGGECPESYFELTNTADEIDAMVESESGTEE
ncbi:MAG: hypothetical protein IJ834_08405 [Paludibacteraceae bacterium]|nr:hypothetical protein [Paludibacteraceae bacterium]